MRLHRGMMALASCAVLGCAVPAWAAEPTTATRPDADSKILAAQTFRTSKLTGLNVRNHDGKVLGEVQDLVLNVKSGKIEYVAMSVGGVLGIGDKLFAVPFDQLKFDHGQDEMFFVLNMSSEKVAAAPGFDQDSWPDFADQHWKDRIDKHYRQSETRTGRQDSRPTTPKTDR